MPKRRTANGTDLTAIRLTTVRADAVSLGNADRDSRRGLNFTELALVYGRSHFAI